MLSTPVLKRLFVPSCLVLGGVACSKADRGDHPEGAGGAGSAIVVGGASSSGGAIAAGGASSGGAIHAGGTMPTGGAPAAGSMSQVAGAGAGAPPGGAAATGGWPRYGGEGGGGPEGGSATGGSPQNGGATAGGAWLVGGETTNGGALVAGGAAAGAPVAGGEWTNGGALPAGGSLSVGGTSGASGAQPPRCDFEFEVSAEPSSAIPTVGVVNWATDLAALRSAEIAYQLNDAGPNLLNRGGRAPMDLADGRQRTLLLGLKGSSTYTFYVVATLADDTVCRSDDYELTTGSTAGAPTIARAAANPSAQAKGFIVTCGGLNSSLPAVIIDADGAVVWWSNVAPVSCSRARMNYEGTEMWAMSLNQQNTGGGMSRVSMDGEDVELSVDGLSNAHHDFTVLPGGIVATLAWSAGGRDAESSLLERTPDGTIRAMFRVGANLYVGGPSVIGGGSHTFHANALLHHPVDNTYTIGDRNPNVFVKVTRSGQPVWQFGGSCNQAPAPRCVPGDWEVNHGHHLLSNGRFLFFCNGPYLGTEVPSRVLEYTLNASGIPMTATAVSAYSSLSGSHSDSLGDVQRLPNGNTLVVFSNNGVIQELDSSWKVVQTLSAVSFGYADWRRTLYGPPER
ncbi:MAG: hypothetical protein JW751_11935 [Polyangiaceae bacterium]|nr:hypothetical protein [Polyangiaceae bacterium]